MADDGDRVDRSRLIDHFKRVYNIVAGLAITEAVRRLFPLSLETFTGPSLWLFLTFFITLVPIFHGGDRSLDLKYLKEPRATGPQRFWYLWDVYILLVTAILFVAIAEAIPKPPDPDAVVDRATTGPYASTTVFFALMAGTLFFDAIVLVVDRFKCEESIRPRLAVYSWWVALNFKLGAVCTVAAFAVKASGSTGTVDVFGHDVPLGWMFPTIAGIALLRTAIDYYVGEDFLFP